MREEEMRMLDRFNLMIMLERIEEEMRMLERFNSLKMLKDPFWAIIRGAAGAIMGDLKLRMERMEEEMRMLEGMSLHRYIYLDRYFDSFKMLKDLIWKMERLEEEMRMLERMGADDEDNMERLHRYIYLDRYFDPFKMLKDLIWKMEGLEKEMRMLEKMDPFRRIFFEEEMRMLERLVADDEDIMELVKTTSIHNTWGGSSHYNLQKIVKSIIELKLKIERLVVKTISIHNTWGGSSHYNLQEIVKSVIDLKLKMEGLGIHSFELLKHSSIYRFLPPEMVKTTPIHNTWGGSSHYNLQEIFKSVNEEETRMLEGMKEETRMLEGMKEETRMLEGMMADDEDIMEVADDEDIMEGIHSFEPLKRSSSFRFLRPEMVKTTPIHNTWGGSSHYNLQEIVKSVIGGSEPGGGRMKKKPQPGPANAQTAVAA